MLVIYVRSSFVNSLHARLGEFLDHETIENKSTLKIYLLFQSVFRNNKMEHQPEGYHFEGVGTISLEPPSEDLKPFMRRKFKATFRFAFLVNC